MGINLIFILLYLSQTGTVTKISLPKICVDPENRCACMILTGKSVAILPFRTRETVGVAEDTLSASSSTG